ncbi:MAG TPA: nitroreductase family protein [Clostridia bacterium]|nr:nitroreductase family protein [Clostridia bacterium]
MDVMTAMQKRKSVRKYLPKEVEDAALAQVLEAARLTPSRHNDQNIRVIIVRDPAAKREICQKADTQPMVSEADVLLVLCSTDKTDFIMPCGQPGYVVDMALATGFMLLAATEQGLDTCIVCAFKEDAVKKILAVPDEARIISMIVMGYEDGEAPYREKKTLSEIVAWEKF